MATLSAAFTVNGNANPAAHSVAYGATVTLARTSTQGNATWTMLSGSNSAMTLPTLTVAAGSNSATFTMVADPADGLGRSVLVKCSVTDGHTTVTEYGVIGVVNDAGVVPIAAGEENYRDATYGWVDAINQALVSQATLITSWVAYTPVTNATVGNGSLTGLWRKIGDSLEVNIYFTLGSTSSIPGGDLYFEIPSDYLVDDTKTNGGVVLSGGGVSDASTGANLPIIILAVNTNQLTLSFLAPASSGLVGGGTPWVWATGDSIGCFGTIPVTLAA